MGSWAATVTPQRVATAFLPQVQQVAAGFGDPLDRLSQLSAAVATLAAQHITGQAFAVYADERHG